MYITMRDGARLAVQVSGDENPEVTMVFAHGWTLDHRLWTELIGRLAAQITVPVQFVSFDNRGHGESDAAPRSAMTGTQYADDIAELADRFGGDKPVVLVGHSAGGIAMSALAARHPELFARSIAGAVFVATTSGPVPRVMRLVGRVGGILMPLLLFLGTIAPAFVPRLLVRGVFGKKVARQEVQLVADQALHGNHRDLGWLAQDLAKCDFHNDVGPYGNIPTLILSGSRDMLLPPYLQRDLAAQIDGAELTVYGSAGHQLPQERPGEMAVALTALVHKVAAAASSGGADRHSA